MKAYEIAEAFRLKFAAAADLLTDPNFGAGFAWKNGQTSATITHPSVVFHCKTASMNSSGTALLFTLTLDVESNADRRVKTDPDPALAHAARVDTLRTKLFASGHSAFLTALNTSTAFNFRDWSPRESDPAMIDRQCFTPIILEGVALLL